jgi:MFS family permease
MKTRDQQARIIAGSLFVSLFFLWGGCYNTSPVFVGALLGAFGWSHARVALIPGTLSLAVGCSGPIAGWLLDRLEARLVMGGGAAVVGVGLLAASRANSFSGLLIANVVIGIGLGASAWLPSTVVIANWFGERRGTALGIATAGMESGGMTMTFLLGYVVGQYGWKGAYIALSIPVLVVVLPLLLTVVRAGPEKNQATATESAQAVSGYEVSEAIRTRVFWMLAVTQLAWGMSAAGVFVHIVAYLMGLGYSLRFATTVIGIFIGLAALGKPTMGAIGDRIGGKNALAIGMALISASIVVLLQAKHEWVIAPYLLMIGVSGAAPAALVPLVLSNTLGLKRFGTLYGWLQVAATSGFFIGPLVVGRIYDLTHSYTESYEIAALIAAIGAAAAFLSAAPVPVKLAVIAQPQKSTV